MPSFIDHIELFNPVKANEFRQLRASELPLVFLGAGPSGPHFYEMLSRQQVIPDYYAVDDPYWNDGLTFMDHKVLKLSEVVKKAKRFNAVVGFVTANPQEVRRRLETFAEIAKVYLFDPPPIFSGLDQSFDGSFIRDHLTAFSESYDMLADETSRQVMVGFLNQRLRGDFTPLEQLWTGDDYLPDCFHLSDDEVFVDGGAFDGDTAKHFAKISEGKYAHIFAFEPDPLQFAKLADLKLERFTAMNLGLWYEQTTLSFEPDGMSGSLKANGSLDVQVEALDHLFEGRDVTYLKLDIEGAEAQALKGASDLIRRCRPKLAVCAYHRKEDLITLPGLIRSLVPEYQLYLRIHRPFSRELVIYAV